jgi:hypothetical protein
MLKPLFLFLFIFTFFGCVNPVDYSKFLRDGDIVDIIFNTKTGKVIADVEFNVDELCPRLVLDNIDLITEGGTVTIHKNAAPKTADITIANSEIYTEIFWFYNADQIADGAGFTASTENPMFLYSRTYFITVVGFADDNKAYGTTFNIMVVS